MATSMIPPIMRKPPRLRALSPLQVYGVCLVMFLEGLSSSSINVQVAAVRADLAPGAVGLQLVAVAFLVSYAALLLPAGRLVDWLDRRLVFWCGLILFGVGSLLGAVAPSVELLVAARLLQGAGAALTAPAAFALLTAPLEEGPERNRVVALYGALGAVGFSTGLVLPGLLVTQLGWRSSFAVLLPFVLVVAVMTARLPAARPQRGRAPDWSGAVALFGVVGLTTYLLGAAPQLSTVALLGLGGIALLLALVVFLRRRQTLPAGVLSQRPVRIAMFALAGAFAGVLSSIYLLTLALQDWHGLDAFTVGLLVLPQPLTFALTARHGASWVGRIGPMRPLTVGLGTIGSAIGLLAVAGTTRPSVGLVILSMALVGAGLALVFPAASIAAVDASPESVRGSTAALLTTAQNIGGSLGLALVTALALVPEPGEPPSLTMPMIVPALVVLFAALSVGLGALSLRAEQVR